MDYTQFRSSSDAGVAVSVNHKALITRALTKYPVDYALFRELLQNSADARAKSATIQFESSQLNLSPSDIHNAPIVRLRFMNDGLDFTNEDWQRLREIASGNPNETKIGAFGVGFYSVFELTDVPLVHSGHEIMNFRYEGVQLRYFFTNKAPQYQKGTLIDLPYRSPSKLPDLVKFVGFLIQSFLLVNLEEVKLELKQGEEITNLLHLSKSTGSASPLGEPKNLNRQSPQRMLKLSGITKSGMNVRINYLNATQLPPLTLTKGLLSFGKQLVGSLITDSVDPAGRTAISCDLIKVDARVDVSVSSRFRQEMISTLLKPPPPQALMSLISLTTDLSTSISSQLKSYIFPKSYNDAKIFIGFPTKQSTGMKSHLSLNQLIPTMERTAIDMSNQFVKDWNGEMLYMAGVMSRCAYEYELLRCQQIGKNGLEQASSVVDRFKLGTSAPDAVIGLYIREGFWRCSKETFVPSSQGILPSSKVRLGGPYRNVLRTTPVVLDDELSSTLEHYGYAQLVSLAEVASDVAQSAIDEDEAPKYVAWLAKMWPRLSDIQRVAFKTALKINSKAESKVFDFSLAEYFHDRSRLPDEEVTKHLPPSCMSAQMAASAGIENLQVLGFHDMPIDVWAEYRLKIMTESPNSVPIACGVLRVACTSWPRLSNGRRKRLIELFSNFDCIPTQHGLKRPRESYFKQIDLFPQLPVVSASLDLPLGWLRDIGVRESMDMRFVLGAIQSNNLRWSNEDLVNYLSENHKSLKHDDWAVLQNGRFFTGNSDAKSLYRAKELLAPDECLSSMGLRTLSFKDWSSASPQARLLFHIGLRRFPTTQELFEVATSRPRLEQVLLYFSEHYDEAQYDSKEIAGLKVIPDINGNLNMPKDLYQDPSLSVFGLSIIAKKWDAAYSKLGVAARPKISFLLSKVLQEPSQFLTSPVQMNAIFSYFSRHLVEFTDNDIRACMSQRFIPVFVGSDHRLASWHTPGEVFLPYRGTDVNEDLVRPLLPTVEPSQSALPFLYQLHISDRPTLSQVVRLLLKDPQSFLNILGNAESYESVLIQMESKWSSLSRDQSLIDSMRVSAFLLGCRFKRPSEVHAQPKNEIALYKASDIAIIDDIIVYGQFKDYVISAPQDELLERLYRRLGVRNLSALLREEVIVGNTLPDEKERISFERRINERLRLFLENTSKEVKRNNENVEVVLVKSIELHRQLPPLASIKVQTSAFMNSSTPNKIFIVPGERFEWIDVASNLVKAVLVKPDQDSVVVLDIQLSSNLNALERKGYNVEKLRRNEREKVLKKVKPVKLKDDSYEPPSRALERDQPQRPDSQDSNVLKKSSGLDGNGERESQSTSLVRHDPSQKDLQPRTHSQPSILSSFRNLLSGASRGATQGPHNINGPEAQPLREAVKRPIQRASHSTGLSNFSPSGRADLPATNGQSQVRIQSVEESLRQALGRAREYDDNNLSAPQHLDLPAPRGSDDCASSGKVHNLRKLATLHNQVRVYTGAEAPRPGQDELVLSELLLHLCTIFGYSTQAIAIYRDPDVSSIAFNYNGSLFFNSCVSPNSTSLLDFYYPVMAHELAHNLVSSHGASHSFYSEAYIQMTLEKYTHYRSTM